jgi:hypothetical protein
MVPEHTSLKFLEQGEEFSLEIIARKGENYATVVIDDDLGDYSEFQASIEELNRLRKCIDDAIKAIVK